MANQVQSKNIGVYLKVGDEYYPVFCGKTMSWNRTQETIETSNINTGSDRDYEAGFSDAVLEIGGVTILDNTEGRISGNYLEQQSVRRQKLDWKITQTDNDGSIFVRTFKGLIVSKGFDKNIPGYSQSNVSIHVCGAVTMETVDPPPTGEYEIISDYWQTVNGQNYISGDSSGEYTGTEIELLEDDIILEVDVEGTGFNLVTGTPTAGERECRFTTSPERITFPYDLIFDGTQRVFVMIKRPVI